MKHYSLSLLCILLVGCSPLSLSNKPDHTITIVTSFYPLTFLAERIVNDHGSVYQVTPSGVEPHDYEPSPQSLAQAYDADVFLSNGAGLDPWADLVHQKRKEKNAISFVLTEQYDGTLLTGSDDEHHEDDEHDTSDGEHHEEDVDIHAVDPHVWLSPMTMKAMTIHVRDALMKQYPLSADVFSKNANQLIAELDALHAHFTTSLSSCKHNTVIVSHDAFQYLAKAYHFQTVAIAGISPDSEPSAKTIAHIIDTIRAKKLPTVFFETLVSRSLSDTIARETGATPLILNPVEGLTEEDQKNGADYMSIMRNNANHLRQGLVCQ